MRWIGAIALCLSLVAPGIAHAGEGTQKVKALTAKQRERKLGHAKRRHRHRREAEEVRVPDRQLLDRLKAAARRTRPGRATPFTTLTTPTLELLRAGIKAGDNTQANLGSPPDTTGAIGPDHYVEFVNTKAAVYDRSNNLSEVSTEDLDSFIGFTGDFVSDPQIQWDPEAGHWFYLTLDEDGNGNDYLAFGWSKTDDPSNLNNGWCHFFVSSDPGGTPSGMFVDDYPKLGHDNDHVIFGSNVFKLSNGAFKTARIWAYDKPSDYGDCNQTLTLFFVGDPTTKAGRLKTKQGVRVFTPVPANTADSSTSGYVVAANYRAFTSSPQIAAWRVTGTSPISIQSRGSIAVGKYGIPPNVPQPGNGEVLDSLDGRLTQAVAHADPDAGGDEAVWTQHTIKGGAGSMVRWYELRPGQCTGAKTCPSSARRQQGDVSDASRFIFNGAISPAMSGNQAVVNYNLGSSSTAAKVRARARDSGTPAGEMGSELVVDGTDNIDKDFTCTTQGGPPCRWGDYAGASPDPNPAHTTWVWGSNQLNGNPNGDDPSWITRNFAIQP